MKHTAWSGWLQNPRWSSFALKAHSSCQRRILITFDEMTSYGSAEQNGGAPVIRSSSGASIGSFSGRFGSATNERCWSASIVGRNDSCRYLTTSSRSCPSTYRPFLSRRQVKSSRNSQRVAVDSLMLAGRSLSSNIVHSPLWILSRRSGRSVQLI